MQDLDTQVRSFRHRAALITAMALGIRGLALWFMLWGTSVLALRAAFDVPRSWLGWGLVGVVPIALVALALGYRRRPTPASVHSLLDLQGESGGLLMASGEIGLGAWQETVGEMHAPRLRGRYSWRLLAIGVGFVAAAFWMPTAPVGQTPERPLAIDGELTELSEKIEVLAEEGWLEEAEAERFEAELQSLSEDASGQDPGAIWEALDHLREAADRSAADVAEAALAEGEQLAAAEAVAEALSAGEAEPFLTSESLAGEAMAELATLSQRAAGGKLLEGAVADELRASAGSSPDLGRLLDALRQGQGDLTDKLDRLYAGGLIDLDTRLAAQQALQNDDLEQLASYLENQGLHAASRACRGGQRPGQAAGAPRGGRGGGLGRGRGDAAMTWQDPSSPAGLKWQEQVLDPSSLAALQESHQIGLVAADPRTSDPASPSTPGSALDPSAASKGGAAYTQTLLPRHRSAVQRYFDRQSSRPETNR